MLKLADVHTHYGQVEALKGVNMEVKNGEIVSLIGSNGAGKSTTLMTISGVLNPVRGKISYQGRMINGLSPHKIVNMGISQVPEGRRIFARLTIMENLEMGAYSFTGKLKTKHKQLATQLEKVFEIFPLLKERMKQQGGTLSGGEQQMLAIGRALMSNPKMLLLDEPSLGLAPIIVSKIFKIIKEINKDSVTILLVEQNAHAALSLANRAYVLENGNITLQGAGHDLMKNEQVKKAYLGE